MRKKTIKHFRSSDLDLWPLDLKFALLATIDQRCVSTELEVFSAFLFRENQKHMTDGRTDGRGATLNAALRESHITTWNVATFDYGLYW